MPERSGVQAGIVIGTETVERYFATHQGARRVRTPRTPSRRRTTCCHGVRANPDGFPFPELILRSMSRVP
jgi:hypothetical protein